MRISDWSSDVCSSDLLLELEIARALKPLRLERLEELYGFSGSRQQLLRNARSGRIWLLVPARSLLTDVGTRVARFELVRPLKHGHITADHLEESNWETVDSTKFRPLWKAELDDAEIGRDDGQEKVCPNL